MSLRLLLLRATAPLLGRCYNYLYWLPWLAGSVAWYARPALRRRVIRNMTPACDGDMRKARKAARVSLRLAAAYWLDLASMPYRDWDAFNARNVRIHNEQYLDALQRPGPVILAGCHSGNPEMAVRALALHGRSEFTALVEPLRPAALGEYMLRLRNAGPGTWLEADVVGARRALRVLKSGGTLGLLVDRDLTGNGLLTTVLGRPVRLPQGPWELARRTGATIIPAFAVRERNDRFTVYLSEPFRIEPDTGPDGDESVRAGAERWARDFEAHLRRFPAQWTVLEDYWKAHTCGQG